MRAFTLVVGLVVAMTIMVDGVNGFGQVTASPIFRYTMIDSGIEHESYVIAGLNQRGQILGAFSTNGEGTSVPAIFAGKRWKIVPGFQNGVGGYITAASRNGTLIGNLYGSPFHWANGKPWYFEPPIGTAWVQWLGISPNARYIVGRSKSDVTYLERGVAFDPIAKKMTSIPDEVSLLRAVNDRGEATGTYTLGESTMTKSYLVRVDVSQTGKPPIVSSFQGAGSDINRKGTIAGVWYDPTSYHNHAILVRRDGQVIHLPMMAGEFSSWANSINDREQVVGYCTYGAVIWGPQGCITLQEVTIGASQYRFVEARKINNRGEILVVAQKKGDQTRDHRLVLLKPVK